MATKNPESKRGSGGGKLSRSETVTVRLDPKLRYLAELAALKQRRTLSSFIEWAINDTLERVPLRESRSNDEPVIFVSEAGAALWDVDDADRFVKLASTYPDLLTYEEQKRWKLIHEYCFAWKNENPESNSQFGAFVETCDFDRLRANWDAFCAVARGDASPDSLPKKACVKPT